MTAFDEIKWRQVGASAGVTVGGKPVVLLTVFETTMGNESRSSWYWVATRIRGGRQLHGKAGSFKEAKDRAVEACKRLLK